MSIFSKLFGAKPRSTPDMKLDSDAQPLSTVNLEFRKARDTSEILGVLRGLIADANITPAKVIFLGKWLTINSEFIEAWPFSELLPEVLTTIERGCSAADLEQTGETIARICGGQRLADGPNELASRPNQLPFSIPAPKVIFPNKEFVLTGRFEFGPRLHCESEITSRGGFCGDSITKRSNYLVIGKFSSRDWGTSAWGNKILKAVEYSEQGTIFIISEDSWRNALGTCPIAEQSPTKEIIPASSVSSVKIACGSCQTKFVHRIYRTKKPRKIICPTCLKEVRI